MLSCRVCHHIDFPNDTNPVHQYISPSREYRCFECDLAKADRKGVLIPTTNKISSVYTHYTPCSTCGQYVTRIVEISVCVCLTCAVALDMPFYINVVHDQQKYSKVIKYSRNLCSLFDSPHHESWQFIIEGRPNVIFTKDIHGDLLPTNVHLRPGDTVYHQSLTPVGSLSDR